jgi:hypothetical protein
MFLHRSAAAPLSDEYVNGVGGAINKISERLFVTVFKSRLLKSCNKRGEE